MKHEHEHVSCFILKGHEPIASSPAAWGRWMETADADRIVAKDDVGEVHVSTVFLGADHNFRGQGPPVLFETMVFGGPFDLEQERYCSWAEAEQGHARMLQRVKEVTT